MTVEGVRLPTEICRAELWKGCKSIIIIINNLFFLCRFSSNN